jgi:hypothetical protein
MNKTTYKYMIKSLLDVISPDVIRIIYFAHFHGHFSSGLIFWGDDSNNNIIFKLQELPI